MGEKIDRFDNYMKFKGLNDNKVTVDIGLSVGTLGKSRKPNRDLSNKCIEQILNFYTDLNRTWLLTGEGEMLRDSYTQTASESKNFTQTGDVNINNNDTALVKAIDEISAQRRLVEKAQEQIDRLITLLENK